MTIKVQKISDFVSPFAGISFIDSYFNQSRLSELIDKELVMRVELTDFQYSEIIINLSNIFMLGCDCIENISTYLVFARKHQILLAGRLFSFLKQSLVSKLSKAL